MLGEARSARSLDSPASIRRDLRGKSTIVYRRILCGQASAPATLRCRTARRRTARHRASRHRTAGPPDTPPPAFRHARHVCSILRQVFVEIFVGNLRLSTGESCVARLRHRPRFAAGQSRRRTPRRRASSSGGARLCARSQAVSPRATTLSASRSLSPYMKWLAMFSENRLASVTRPTASATSRMCMGVAPQQTPM